MTKKIFALFLAIVFALFTTSVFAANNEIGDSLNKAGNSVRNVIDGAGTVIKDGVNGITNGVQNAGNAVSNGSHTVGNTISNTNTQNTNTDNDGYNATRTIEPRTTTARTNNTFLGMSGTTWTWFILAIAALAIIGLVWYYAMQNKNEYNDNH